VAERLVLAGGVGGQRACDSECGYQAEGRSMNGLPYQKWVYDEWIVGAQLNIQDDGALLVGRVYESVDGRTHTSYDNPAIGRLPWYTSPNYIEVPMRWGHWYPPPIPEDPACANQTLVGFSWVDKDDMVMTPMDSSHTLLLAAPVAWPVAMVALVSIACHTWLKSVKP
jgi:hypothetical protein